MRLKWIPTFLALTAFGLSVSAQTSVAVSGYVSVTGTVAGNGIAQSAAAQAGGLIEVRHIASPLLGFEATYSLNRANQTYSTDVNGVFCPAPGCTISKQTVSADAHEITADWVPSFRMGKIRPFGILGGGALIVAPSSGQAVVFVTAPCGSPGGTGNCPGSSPYTSTSDSNTTTSTQAVYVYGAGLDWNLLRHLGLRVQYRGNLYRAPGVTTWFSSTRISILHTAEPMAGAYFNF
jgi:opacity protein-like surface antigen